MMSYGLSFTNNSGLVVLDSEYARLCVIASGRYAPTGGGGFDSTTSFPRIVTSQEPPLVFIRPDTGATAGLVFAKLIGSAGNWTGFYVRRYSINVAEPNGRYFVATFGAQAVSSYGLRLFDPAGKMIYDSGTPSALFTRAFQGWTYQRYETDDTGSTRIFYTVPFNFPEDEYMLINTFGMRMVTGAVSGRFVSTLWDFAGGTLYAVTVGFTNPFNFFMPAVFAKMNS